MRSLLIRCYPAGWRARYGDEFKALLEERPLGPFDVADVLLGALDAQLRLRLVGADLTQARRFSMSLRIGGFAGILAASLLALAWFLGYGIVEIDPIVPGVMLLAGLFLLLVALAGLTAFQARANPRVTWAAFIVPAIGLVVFSVGALATVVTGSDYWELTMLGVLTGVAGSALFAIVTYRTAVLSRGGALLIGVGSPLVVAAAVTSFYVLLVVAIVCFLLGWFALGIQAIRIDRPSTEPRPA